MKRNKIVSILEYSARNKMLVGILAASLIGAGGIFLANNAALSNNTMGINKTVLAGTMNNDGNKACVINGDDNLVLYTSAESNSNVESYISVGEMLTINSYSNGYYNVTVEETGVTGYISSANMEKIVSGTGDSLTSLNETAYVTNVTSDVNLREDATMNSTTLLKLTNNTQVTLLGKEGEWYKVDANGTTGYIYEEYIAIANTSTSSSSSQSTTEASSNQTSDAATASSNSSTASSSSATGTSSSQTSDAATASNNNSSSASSSDATGTPTYKTTKIAYIYIGNNGTTGAVSIYKTSKAETVETTLKGGTKVTVLNLTDGLSEIEYGNNQIGYVSAGYLTSVNPEDSSSTNGTASNQTSGTATASNNSKVASSSTSNSNTTGTTSNSETSSSNKSSNSTTLSQLKEKYLSQISEVNNTASSISSNTKNENPSQYQIDNSESKIYTLYKTELNNIYTQLEKSLPANEFSQLQQAQNSWIDSANESAQEYAKSYAGNGSDYTAILYMKLGQLYSARCSYLVNEYM